MIAALTRVDDALAWLSERRPLAMIFIAAFALILFLPGFASLPPTDRDEARFAQASRQMAETGDLIDIRLAEGTRYKKPVGIYWLQTLAVRITGEPNEIWAYRLPSLVAGVAASLLTYLVALALMGGRVAFLSGLLMASTLTLGAEARIAKTDATLLAMILLTLWPLARLHMTGTLLRPWLFWVALGASMLIKGPIGVMVVGLAIAALCLIRRDWRWLAALNARTGVLIFAGIVLPWYVAISVQAGWAFWEEALIGDFLSKIGEGQESHGAPPGTYLLTLWLTFWPAAILLPLGLWFGWTRRAQPGVQFCLAWVLPSWIVFEITATKLLHYVLPLYPALAILTAAGWLALGSAPGRALRIGMGVVLAIALLLAAAPLVFTLGLGGWPGPLWILGLVLLALGAVLVWASLSHGLNFAPAVAAGLLTLGTMTGIFASLARFEAMWPSNALAAMVAEVDCPAPVILSAGYHEASLVFLTSSWPRFTSAEEAATGGLAAGCAVAFVDSRHQQAFDAALAEAAGADAGSDAGAEPQVTRIGQYQGFTMGRAEEVQITGWAFTP